MSSTDLESSFREYYFDVNSVFGEVSSGSFLHRFKTISDAVPYDECCCSRISPPDDKDPNAFVTTALSIPGKKIYQRVHTPADIEFVIYSRGITEAWHTMLLFRFFHFAWKNPDDFMAGLPLPLTFYRDLDEEVGRLGNVPLHAALVEDLDEMNYLERGEKVGTLCHLFFWPSITHNSLTREDRSEIGFMSCFTFTREERDIAEEIGSYPMANILVELGVGQVIDPFRESVTLRPGFNAALERCRQLSHEEAVSRLLPFDD